jgi:hypothetical protein
MNQVSEVVVVSDRYMAEAGGFTWPDWRHHADPTIMVWWPKRSLHCLEGLTVRRVTVDSSAARLPRAGPLLRALDLLRTSVKTAPAPVWMVL